MYELSLIILLLQCVDVGGSIVAGDLPDRISRAQQTRLAIGGNAVNTRRVPSMSMFVSHTAKDLWTRGSSMMRRNGSGSA